MALHPDVLRCLDEVDVVSLDVFDTSLHRAVLDPVDLFSMVPERVPDVTRALGTMPVDTGSCYRTVRRRAERSARIGAPAGEIGFAEIIDELARIFGDRALAERLGQAELELELELIRASEPGLEVTAEVVRRGRRLVYLSDMYLSSSFIAQLLRRAGLPVAPIFVSNEHGAAKASGGLYQVLLDSSCVPAGRVVHIGDDAVADHRGALRAGLRTLDVGKPSAQYRRHWERYPVPRELGLDDSLTLGVAGPAWARTVAPLRADDAVSRLEAIGEAVLGPAVLSFTAWIAERAGRGSSPLLFCSRDGLLPLQCYDRMAERWSCTAPAQYFHVSRRSVAVPALSDGIHDADRDLLCGGRRPRSAWQLFDRVGLGRELATAAARTIGVGSIDRPLPSGRARDTVFDMFRAVEAHVVEHSRIELEAFGQYWKEAGLDAVPEVVVVDVGWRATVQRALQECLGLLDQPTVVRGLYLSLLDHVPLEPGRAEGMVVHDGRPWWRRATMEAGVPVVELMFQADHGSVVSYRDGRPVLGPPGLGRDIVDPIQRGASSHLDAVAALSRPVRPTRRALDPLLRLLTQPRPSEAGDIGRFEHSDGLADDANATSILPARVRARQLLPTAAGRATVRSSEWRPGMMALATRSPATRFILSNYLSALKLAGGVTIALASRRRRRRGSPSIDQASARQAPNVVERE